MQKSSLNIFLSKDHAPFQVWNSVLVNHARNMGKAFDLHAEFLVLESLVTPKCKSLCLYHPTDINNKEAEESHCAALPWTLTHRNIRRNLFSSFCKCIGIYMNTFYVFFFPWTILWSINYRVEKVHWYLKQSGVQNIAQII